MSIVNTELELLQKLIDLRFGQSDDKIANLTKAIERLSGAIITAEVFNELASDLKAALLEIANSKERIRDLEEKARLGRNIVFLLSLVIGPIAILKLQELFGS